jgi:membrane associated rhomboid family serine protease
MYLGAPTSVAYFAHIGGFLAGMAFILPFKKSKL